MKGSELIRAVGEALYGAHWQSPLARDLQVSDRTVRFWTAGERAVPDTILPILIELLRNRGAELTTTTALVERYMNRDD